MYDALPSWKLNLCSIHTYTYIDIESPNVRYVYYQLCVNVIYSRMLCIFRLMREKCCAKDTKSCSIHAHVFLPINIDLMMNKGAYSTYIPIHSLICVLCALCLADVATTVAEVMLWFHANQIHAHTTCMVVTLHIYVRVDAALCTIQNVLCCVCVPSNMLMMSCNNYFIFCCRPIPSSQIGKRINNNDS